jgi:soluble lytic murein transglycosylase
MKKKTKKKMIFLLLLVLVGVLLWSSDLLEQWLYPIQYHQEIKKSAMNHDLNPLLVAAIIRAESNYKPHLVSKKGAVGLMQLMPDTAEWAAGRMGIDPPVLAQLHEPQLNIEIGCWYLQSLYDQFDGNEVVMIAAYNAGPTNVRRWLDEGIWDGSLDTTNKIPFGETRHYIKRVQRYLKKYKELYGVNGEKHNEIGALTSVSTPIPTHLSKY